MSSSPSVSVLLVVGNALPRLRDCLASIADDVNSGFAEVIAADNASPDGSVAAVKAASPDGTVVRMQENLGFASGGNTVLRQGLSQWASLVETV